MDVAKTRLDLKAANEGVWFKVDKTTKFLIARLPNDAFQNKFERLAGRKQTAVARNQLDKAESNAIVGEACVGTVLLDWEGLEENGQKLPFTPENAKRLMTDPAHPEFQEIIIGFAQEKAAFREELIEEDIKKSVSSSGGKAAPKQSELTQSEQ